MPRSTQEHGRTPAPVPAFWLIVVCLALAACGGGGSGSNDPGQPQLPAGPPSISIDSSEISFTRDRGAVPGGRRTPELRLHNTTTAGLVLFGDYTQRVITDVAVDLSGSTTVPLHISVRPPETLFNGTYTDQLTLHACLDQACNQPLEGSPLVLTLTYTVTGTDPVTGDMGPPADPDAAPLAVQSRVALTHDVRDAEYSRSFERIVMAATYPANALYIYDAATGTEQSVPLSKPPTAVTISPDGLTAAVGHDGLISIVDLAQVGQVGAHAPLLLNTSVKIFDLVLDGHGHVQVIPDNFDEQEEIHTIDIATNTEQVSGYDGLTFGSTYARLHPSGNTMFVGNQFVSPSHIERWDVTGAAAQWNGQSSFDMAYSRACGNLWFDESGSHVYSQCGPVLPADSPTNVDSGPIGRLELSGPELTADHYTIAWLDQLAARNEIALIEANASWCALPIFGVACYHRLGIVDSNDFTRQSLHALAPITVTGQIYGQRGLFVFYKSDGSSKFLLSRLDAISDPDNEYYLSVLE